MTEPRKIITNKIGIINLAKASKPGDEFHVTVDPNGDIHLTHDEMAPPASDAYTGPNVLPDDATTTDPDFPYGHIPEDHYLNTEWAGLSELRQQYKWEAQNGHPNNFYTSYRRPDDHTTQKL